MEKRKQYQCWRILKCASTTTLHDPFGHETGGKCGTGAGVI